MNMRVIIIKWIMEHTVGGDRQSSIGAKNNYKVDKTESYMYVHVVRIRY